jgi:hypothetical protein
MKIRLARRTVAEFIGTAFLGAAVVGSGRMADRLSGAKGGDTRVAEGNSANSRHACVEVKRYHRL